MRASVPVCMLVVIIAACCVHPDVVVFRLALETAIRSLSCSDAESVLYAAGSVTLPRRLHT